MGDGMKNRTAGDPERSRVDVDEMQFSNEFDDLNREPKKLTGGEQRITNKRK